MATELATVPAASEIELEEEQRKGLDAADRWAVEALAELGAATLEYQETEQRFEMAKKRLGACSRRALQAEKQCAQVMQVVAQVLQLGPGDWTYDPKTGKLMRKESANV